MAPAEEIYYKQLNAASSRWTVPPIVEELKREARKRGLWNLFLPKYHPEGAGLSNLEYAYLAELMGSLPLSAEACNCSAPDTGNMEVLAKYGTPEQKKRWLVPLLEGDIRSVFFMTEPAVASSDATNIATSIRREGDDYVINGRKWWSSGVLDPRCKVGILMGKTDPNASVHQQQSMVIVPMDTPGIIVQRALTVFGYDDAPHGHGEVIFNNVRVPVKDSLLLGEGRGFEIAQGRLGPGRIHHCMRTIGVAERALRTMIDRVTKRYAFGRKLAKFGTIRVDIARSRMEIDMCRLLTLQAAAMIDAHGDARGARKEIAAIKVAAPEMALKVIDRAIQAYGGSGVSQDQFLAYAYAQVRTLRLADGPDEVHLRTISRVELRRPADIPAFIADKARLERREEELAPYARL